jgi:26S proteasome regulatory subunit N3
MKQEGSARRRGADKAKPPPGGGEQEPPPPPGPQDVEMKEEAAAGSSSTGEADGKAATAEHSQRELDTVTLEGTRARVGDITRSWVTVIPMIRLLHGTAVQPPPTPVP